MIYATILPMKSKIISFVIGFLAAAMLLQKCQHSKPVHGHFAPAKPTTLQVVKYVHGKATRVSVADTSLLAEHRRTIDSLVGANAALLKDFKKASDTIRLTMYESAITPTAFTRTVDDSAVTITAAGIAKGTVESLSIDYTIKKQPDNSKMLYGGLNYINGQIGIGAGVRVGKVLIFGTASPGVALGASVYYSIF